jgi:hypothetical protein
MKNRSAPPGESTLAIEFERRTEKGFWLLVGTERLFLPFSEFPWFRHATDAKLKNVARPHADRLYWPELDIDLAIESIRNPRAFPLVSRRH